MDKVSRKLAKSFISITLNCFRSPVAVRMAEEGTDDVLYLLAKNHVLVGIIDEVLETLNLLQMDLGALEGQTSRGLFSNSIFDFSLIGAIPHPESLS